MPDITVKKEYRNVVLRIGVAMIMQTLLVNLIYGIGVYLPIEGVEPKTFHILISLFDSGAYIFSFLFPAWFFFKISSNKRVELPWCEVKISGSYPLMLLAGLGVILFFAYINAYVIDIFVHYESYEGFSSEYTLSENYDLIISIISNALVPAFCEEFLFRGVVLSNLSPYGNKSAILISAILFGLMHQNLGQIIYATIAGLIIGYIYVKNHSIWGCVLLHFINNVYYVITTLLYSRMGEEAATKIVAIADNFIIGIGFLSLFVIVFVEICFIRKKSFKTKSVFLNGSFGSVLTADNDYSEHKIAVFEKVNTFFVPTITAFVAICCIIMVYNFISGF